MIRFENYIRVKTVKEAYERNQSFQNVVGGGMMWLHLSEGEYDTLIDLCDLGLDQIEEEETYLKIGAMTTLSQLENSERIKEYFGSTFEDCLKHIVGVQFRNSATIGGSIVARLGFSDIITLLLPLETQLRFYSQGQISLQDYLSGKNQRDILEYILIPKKKKTIRFESIRRTYTDTAVLNVCGTKEEDGYRFAVGARPGVAILVKEDEEVLFGDNQRGSKEYRKHVYEILKKRIKESLEEETCG
ncbi:MAG: FAD binding domain-containing protein [Erysipelotrichaceae bacterium]|nr:FAD binding domain-containing protein [Erysipelotrichaceae bacterium]